MQKYVDLLPLVSRPSLYKLAMTTRSDGKTTFAKCHALETFYNTEKTPLFLRRFTREIVTGEFLTGFAQNIITARPELLAGRSYEVRGSEKKGFGFYVSDKGGKAMRRAIGIYAVSTAYRMKSAFDWATNKNIYFDEYIPLDGVYIRKEMINLLELYKTVDRKHYDNFILFTGNKVDTACDFFRFFGLSNFRKNGITTFRGGSIDVFLWTNKTKSDNESGETLFEKMVSGTEYDGYNSGEFMNTHDNAIKKEHYKTAFYNIFCAGKWYAAFLGDNCLVLREIARPIDSAPLCSFGACGANYAGVPMLQNAEVIRRTLSAYKYNNRLFFYDENTMQNLAPLYKFL